MEKIINIYKPVGLTPLQLITQFRIVQQKYKQFKIGFAGRLDPLAHGVMLLMIGEETKNRDKYLGLKKTYEFEIVFGVATDTYDVLGILQTVDPKKVPDNLEEKINSFVKSKIGKQLQAYPPYSAREVNGKPLYIWARENKLSEINIPKKEIEIYDFDLLNISEIPTQKLHKIIVNNINSVIGDFRQEKILEAWSKFFKMNILDSFATAKFRVNCSSGTYVRSLANELGEKLGSGAVTISILRTRVGKYNLDHSIKL